MITLTKNETIIIANCFNDFDETKNVKICPFFNDGPMTFGMFIDFVSNNTKYVFGIDNANEFTITNIDGNIITIDDVFDVLVHYIDWQYNDLFLSDEYHESNFTDFEYHYIDNNKTKMIVTFIK